jgi:hypothetical protein
MSHVFIELSLEEIQGLKDEGKDRKRLFVPNDKSNVKFDDTMEFHSGGDDTKAKCPCSDKWDNVIQSGDYVSHPMVWCDDCGRRSFICIYCQPETFTKKDCVVYKYPLVKVLKVINRQIYDWKWTPDLFGRQFQDMLRRSYSEENDFAESIGLEKQDDWFAEDPENIAENIWHDYGVECNSTNVEDVKNTMPLDLSHDGIYVYCQCRCDSCGTEFNARYWGD